MKNNTLSAIKLTAAVIAIITLTVITIMAWYSYWIIFVNKNPPKAQTNFSCFVYRDSESDDAGACCIDVDDPTTNHCIDGHGVVVHNKMQGE